MKRSEMLKKLEEKFSARFNVQDHIANRETRWFLDLVEELGMIPPEYMKEISPVYNVLLNEWEID